MRNVFCMVAGYDTALWGSNGLNLQQYINFLERSLRCEMKFFSFIIDFSLHTLMQMRKNRLSVVRGGGGVI
jgi:hypothetical protein